ncbi:MAG: hypothetical protein IJ679_08655, partial [Lachnospiraceae bacterium]|nr:hypothetical protein [Lachnospiraceae bacterium]
MKYLGNIKEHCKYGCNRNDCKYRNEKNICAKTENICNSDVINTTIERKKLANKKSNKQSN